MNPILVINAGCSSVKFQVFGIDGTRKLERLIKGEIDGIGTQPRLRVAAANGEDLIDQAFPPEHVADVPAALTITEDWLREIRNFEPIAVGLRAWRSNLRSAGFGRRRGPCRSRTLCFSGAPSPAKQPRAHPFASCKVSALPQVACFDMAFHRGHDAVVDHYAIPDRFYAEGVRRYGFHGLSYEFVASRLAQMVPEIAAGRVIIAHLGSGASMCAHLAGRSIECGAEHGTDMPDIQDWRWRNTG
jgi:acetate kinase